MLNVKHAVKATIARLAEFVIAASPKEKNAKTGVMEPSNKKGNILFSFDGRSYETFSEAVERCGGESETLAILNAAFADAQRNAYKAVVSADDAIAPTVDLSSVDAQNAERARLEALATTAAGKVNRPEVSSRAEAQAANAVVDATLANIKAGVTVSQDEMLAALEAVARLRK